MGYIYVSDTRNEIHHILKDINRSKNKRYEVLNISEIRKNKKNPKFCSVKIDYLNIEKCHQARARPDMI